MNYLQFSIIILASLMFAFQSCTKDTIELLSPETVEKTNQEVTQEVDLKFRFEPDDQEVWTNLVWNEDGSWERNDIGRTYPSQTNWLQIEWKPQDNQIIFQFKYEILRVYDIELYQNETCGEVERERIYQNENFYVLKLDLNDDFINCLDGTGEEIDMQIRLKL